MGSPAASRRRNGPRVTPDLRRRPGAVGVVERVPCRVPHISIMARHAGVAGAKRLRSYRGAPPHDARCRPGSRPLTRTGMRRITDLTGLIHHTDAGARYTPSRSLNAPRKPEPPPRGHCGADRVGAGRIARPRASASARPSRWRWARWSYVGSGISPLAAVRRRPAGPDARSSAEGSVAAAVPWIR